MSPHSCLQAPVFSSPSLGAPGTSAHFTVLFHLILTFHVTHQMRFICVPLLYGHPSASAKINVDVIARIPAAGEHEHITSGTAEPYLGLGESKVVHQESCGMHPRI